MIIISHRGNISGSCPKLENQPSYILNAIKQNYYVEADIWRFNGILYLGHDNNDYRIDSKFLNNNKIIWHCKNIEALQYFYEKKSNLHYFWHKDDSFTFTSKGIVWAYPGYVIKNCIIVSPELLDRNVNFKQCHGICTDYPIKYKDLI